jgi:glycerophosphoryl diester phosphodiesterase
MVLFEEMDGGQAMLASQRVTAGHRRKIALWLVEWILAVVLLSASVSLVVGRLGDVLIEREGLNLALLMTGLCAVLVGSWLAGLAVTVFTTVLFPLLVVRLYRSVAGPGALRPDIADRGTLGERASFRIPGKIFLLGAVVALAMVSVGAYVAARHLDGGNQAQIIAHRGGAAVAPENTIAAFKRGIADGADWLELDVQENADGVVVIEHDRDFMRVAGVNLEVWKATNADLADMDVGSFFDPAFSDQRVPTLRDVLELAKGRAGVFIELKYYGHDENLEAKVVDVVEATRMVPNIVIMSLNYDGVRKAAGLRPTWTYGLLNAVAIGDLTHLDVDFLALTAKAASYGTIRRAHKRGMKVYAWTVDDPVQMSVMMSRGVDGIITDKVALARQVQEIRVKLTPLGRFVVWMAGESGLLRGMEKSSARDDA